VTNRDKSARKETNVKTDSFDMVSHKSLLSIQYTVHSSQLSLDEKITILFVDRLCNLVLRNETAFGFLQMFEVLFDIITSPILH
jgi:hypothetical protein